jgi:transporter family protein
VTLSGFLIGGVIPAVCLGLVTVLMRASLGAGASIPL